MNTRTFARRTTSLALLALTLSPWAAAQHGTEEAVVWKTSAVAVKSSGTERLYRLEFSGRIAPGYIVYGSDFKAELGPNPTRLRLDKNEAVTTREDLKSIGAKPATDETFKTDYTFFEGEAGLSQIVEVGPGVKSVSGTLRGQTCHKADGTCALFSAKFEAPLP